MTRRYVDLSMTLENDIVSDPPFLKPTITYETHAETKHELGHWFDPEEAEGMHGGQPFCAAEWVKLTTHSGTHVDAPWHYHASQDAALALGGVEITVDADWVPRIRLDDVRLLKPSGQALLTLPDVRLTVDLGALLHGQVRAGSLKLVGAHIEVKRDRDGSLTASNAQQLQRWHEAGHAELMMAVNLSARQFQRVRVVP